jgi:RNA polymerase sigma-70 factor, ECF subfamily
MCVDELDYEQIVASHHEEIYRFAFSLTGNRADACDLTQETYVRLLMRGRQLRDRGKVKSWLFTTLYRIFLGRKRHESRFPHFEIYSVENEVPPLTPEMADQADAESVMDAALSIEPHYRAPLVLYYLEGLSYREIAGALDMPVGTVMSRLSRGKEMIRQRLAVRLSGKDQKVARMDEFRPSNHRSK